MFTILEADNELSYQYSDEDIRMFCERKERYLKEEGKNFSVEESFDEIRKNK